jgi:RNA-splicing ligase RtcB
MKGIFVKAHGDWGSPAEEASVAYKDVEVCHNAGLCKKVARMKPVGVIKG